MNVEGDFRYVDPGAFDECIDFVEFLDEREGNWDDAFIGWNRATKQRRDKRISSSHWSPWNFVKVYIYIQVISLRKEVLSSYF